METEHEVVLIAQRQRARVGTKRVFLFMARDSRADSELVIVASP
jgi:hypothetical protein